MVHTNVCRQVKCHRVMHDVDADNNVHLELASDQEGGIVYLNVNEGKKRELPIAGVLWGETMQCNSWFGVSTCTNHHWL